MDMMDLIGRRAKEAAGLLALLSTVEKDRAILAIADALEKMTGQILLANQKDLDAAVQNGMSTAMQDRLRLTPERIASMAGAARECAALPDPVGQVIEGSNRPNGLQITKVAVPLGVVGIIFESRPNATVDCAVLCLKAGNACILRGGKEAIHSNTALAGVMRTALESVGVIADAVQLIEDTSRESAVALMRLNQYVDVLVPRGGIGLIRSVVENATIPVIETGAGVCHAYVESSADLEMAANIVHNGKTSRPSVCNALECLLVDSAIAGDFLPLLARRLDSHKVEIRGCPNTCKILGDRAVPAADDDYGAEFFDFILAVKVVTGIDEAIAHIRTYSTRHSEVIVTRNLTAASRFTREVDSAAVYVNASTRFTDGGEFGLGAEIGISTQKLHARGPMGLRELVSYKYIIAGDGQVR
ncbi:MAG: glutamate-5-semialdehyde dehydrogenase [Oscillospiraceae bacterium]|nr:glutamate-5-semialdehyde dehydrogenase [Oscillospiraceae bacterium]